MINKKQELIKILGTIENDVKHIRKRIDTMTNDKLREEIDIANQIKFLLAPI